MSYHFHELHLGFDGSHEPPLPSALEIRRERDFWYRTVPMEAIRAENMAL